MDLDMKIAIIQTALRSITSFPVEVYENTDSVCVRVKFGFIKDYIYSLTKPFFMRCSCHSIIVDCITGIQCNVYEYTTNNDNYRMVIQQLTSAEFKEKENVCSK